ncbi:MAG: VOC family protein [Mycobacterium sp.]|jgi:catechol 2,3-dioxygenase-like lactoylglutathione lyase family enzyme|uniref:VOC family protein n=1 Tax=Mycobacterium sp. TaxID=1785 RepID=UPI00389AC6FF
MAAPRLKRVHHIKLPVTDLDTSLNWYRRVLDAEHLTRFDHYDGAGTRYAVILQLPGVDIPIELRWAPDAAAATVGYDPVHFVAGGTDDLQAWVAHLDTLGIEHSPVITALAGQLLIFRDPDQTYLHLLTAPEGGVLAIEMNRDAAEPEGPWIMPDLMRHP